MKTMNMQAIRLDENLQSRVSVSEDVINDYADALKEGAQFPPVIVFFDGTETYLADGWHRYRAHEKLGRASINVQLMHGTWRDAKFFSISANNGHGLRKSNADKRKSIMDLLEDFEWHQMSDREIAKKCGTSTALVTAVRAGQESGEQVSTTGLAKKKPKQDKPDTKPEPRPEPDENLHDDAVQELVAENERLTQRLAVAAMDATDDEKNLAQQTIEELREEVRMLRIENEALIISRDTYQQENAQLKKQIAMLNKKR